MNSYNASSGVMDLGTTASGTVIAALNNPAGSGKNLLLKNAAYRGDFVGTPGLTRVLVSVNRATGTAAGGTGSKSGTGIAKRNPGHATSIASFFWGPSAITGLTDASPEGVLKSVSIPSTLSTVAEDIIEDIKDFSTTDPLVIVPGTSLIFRTASISIAGTGFGIDLSWGEQ